MKYLFFDIECSDGIHMCSFGYVLTDESFNVLKKEDILMNPEAVFHTGAWGKKNRETQPGIQLYYPKEEFLHQPTFPRFYKKIKQLITAENQLVVGFSHKNDTVFLDNACRKYGFESIDYDFYDVQIIHKEASGLKNPASTETLVEELQLDVKRFIPHKSDDDAEVSMLLTKKFCESENCSLPTLIEKFPNCVGCHHAQKTVYKYKTRAESFIKVINRDSTSGNNFMRGNNFTKYKVFLEDCEKQDVVPKNYEGKKVVVSRGYVDNHFREMLILAERVMDRGGELWHRAVEADIYIDFGDGKNGELKGVKNAIKRGAEIGIISFEDFLKSIDITEEYLAAAVAAKLR